MDQLTETADILGNITGEDDNNCLHLTRSEKLIGFGICALCSILSGVLSIVALFMLNIRKFSVLFTFSTLLLFASITLLIGFKALLKSCSDKKRLTGSICLVCGMIITLICGLKHWIIITIISFAGEMIAYIYFALSYFPGGIEIFHWMFF